MFLSNVLTYPQPTCLDSGYIDVYPTSSVYVMLDNLIVNGNVPASSLESVKGV